MARRLPASSRHAARVAATLAVLVPLAAAGRAWGDGGFVAAAGAAVETAEQRAVIWTRPDRVDLYVQTGFEGAAGSFGWVLPLPAVPAEVAEADAAFLDVLDLMTAPWSVEICTCPCEGSAGGEGDGTAGVTVWDAGTVGDLDYVIISASTGGELTAWLETQGFELAGGAGEVLDWYAANDFVLFAARISPGAVVDGGLSPVRFSLPAGTQPQYPMRLTAPSTSDRLRVLVWTIGETAMTPTTYPWAEVDLSGVWALSEYESAREELLAGGDGRTFAVEFAGPLHSRAWDATTMFGADPEAVPEIREILEGDLTVTRLVAALPAEGMTEEVVLDAAEDLWVDVELRDYYSSESCCDFPCEHGADGDADADSDADVDGDVDSDSDADSGEDGAPARQSAAGGSSCSVGPGSAGGAGQPLAGLVLLLAAGALVARGRR